MSSSLPYDPADTTVGGPVCAFQGVGVRSPRRNANVSTAEMQADSMTRSHRELRIASLRFHRCCADYAAAVPDALGGELYSWVSYDACSLACERGLTSEGWEGHEIFNIVAPEIAWEGGVHPRERSAVVLDDKVGSLELLNTNWKGRYSGLISGHWRDEGWRNTFWDTSKAQQLLDWSHDCDRGEHATKDDKSVSLV